MIALDRLPAFPRNGRRRRQHLGHDLRHAAEGVQDRFQGLVEERRRARHRAQGGLHVRPASGVATAALLGLGVALLAALAKRARRDGGPLGDGGRMGAGWRGFGSAPTTDFPEGLIDDASLEQRVRSALDRVRGHTGGIDAQARGGVVVLSGPALADELPQIRAAVRGTRGVRDLVEMLDVRDEPAGEPALEGPEGRKRDAGDGGWRPWGRLAAVGAGWFLAAGSVRAASRAGRPLLAAPGVIVGGALALRGITNRPLGRMLEVGRGRRGIDIERSIELDAPVEEAFALWDREPEFPNFMSHVRDVRMNRDGTSDWTIAGPAGIPIGFRAETTERIPNERIAWQSLEGEPIRHSGTVQFDRRPANRCRLRVRMTYQPPAGILGHALAQALGADPGRALDDDLRRFQLLLARRGRTAGEEVTRPMGAVGEVAPSAAAWSPMGAGVAATAPGEEIPGAGGPGMSAGAMGATPGMAAQMPGEIGPAADTGRGGGPGAGMGADAGPPDEEGATHEA